MLYRVLSSVRSRSDPNRRRCVRSTRREPQRRRLVLEGLEDRRLLNFGDLLQTLYDPTAQIGAHFGRSVAADASLAVLGVPYADEPTGVPENPPTYICRAYVFNLITGALVSTLGKGTPPGPDLFGHSVALSGSTAVVGAPYDSTIAAGGAAYVFDASTGTLLLALANPTPGSGDRFGWSVAVSGSIAVVGAPFDDAGATDAGSAYVFDVATGDLLSTLNNPASAAYDEFGLSAAISGATVVVGAPYNDNAASAAGSAFVFDATSGNLLCTLANPTPAVWEEFGYSVAASGSMVAVGAPYDSTGATSAGTAYVFDVASGNLLWTLNNPIGGAYEYFGSSVGGSAGAVVVGTGCGGSAYVFDAATGSLIRTLNNPTPAAYDEFGYSVAVSGSRAVVGDPHDETVAAVSGAAYVFDLTPNAATFDGTASKDVFAFSSDGTTHRVTVTLAGGSTTHYSYPASDPLTLTFNGVDGNDKLTVLGGPGTETGTISRYSLDLTGPGYRIFGSNLEIITVDARGGTGQTATLYNGPVPGDVFTASAGFRTGSMVGTGAGNVYRNSVRNFDTISGYATGGGTSARAYLYDSNGNDLFESQAGRATDPHSSIRRVSGGTGLAAYVYAGPGFDYVYGLSTAGGVDEAVLYGSDGDDSMRFQPGYTSGTLVVPRAYITRPGNYFIYAQNFKKITGYPDAGNDQVAFFDTAGNDAFTASPTDARLTGPAGSNILCIATTDLVNQTYRWDTVRAYSQVGGYDKAYLTGSTGPDTFLGFGKPRTANAGLGRLSGSGYFLEVYQFEEAYANLLTGNDTANLYDGSANDYFWAKLGAAVLTDGTVNDTTGDLMTPNTYYYKVYGFDSAASDRVSLWGTSGGTNTKRVITPLDYLLATYGTWTDAP